MSIAVPSQPYVTVDEFLAVEELSGVKCEYLGGVVHAMAGANDPHNDIAFNLYGMLYNRLRGRRCKGYGPEMKVRLQHPSSGSTCFYYPDALIACNPADVGRGWREQPAALFEILSESTRQIDERDKRAAYLGLHSLEAYVRIEQDRPEVVVERRTIEGWQLERITGLDAVVRLPTLEIELPLAELYEWLTFPDPVETAADGGGQA